MVTMKSTRFISYVCICATLCIAALMSVACSSDTDDDSKPEASVLWVSSSIANGAEVDADITKSITITYSTAIDVAESATITLNDIIIDTANISVNGNDIIVNLRLEKGKQYRLVIPSGDVVSKKDPTDIASELKITFSTKKAV